MVDIDTFLTILYVMVDDFRKQYLVAECRPDPAAALTRSEVVTLALFGQWHSFASERGFYRYAQRHLRGAFPTLPDRAPFNRARRQHAAAGVNCFLHLVQLLQAQRYAYEALDGTAAVTRDSKRRGLGWLPGVAGIGWSHRWDWYESFHVLLAVNPSGVITDFGFGSASTKDQPLAETFFALRTGPDPRVASVGAPAQGPDVTDKGFEGEDRHRTGKRSMALRSSVRPSVTAVIPGRGLGGAGWPASAKSWRPLTAAFSISFASIASALTLWMAFRSA